MIELRENGQLPIISRTQFIANLRDGKYSIPELMGSDVILLSQLERLLENGANEPSEEDVLRTLDDCVFAFEWTIENDIFLDPERCRSLYFQAAQLAFDCAAIQVPELDPGQLLSNGDYTVEWIKDCLVMHVQQVLQVL
jgi:hypothetical protein